MPAEDIENIGEYLENLRSKITPALQKVIGQTQRIHTILTDLMQFARPSTPRLQALSVKKLMKEVAESLSHYAQERKVRLVSSEPEDELRIQNRPAQGACRARLPVRATPSKPLPQTARRGCMLKPMEAPCLS